MLFTYTSNNISCDFKTKHISNNQSIPLCWPLSPITYMPVPVMGNCPS